jgi:hypothetical protein
MQHDQDPKEKIPVYSIFNECIGEMTIKDAVRHCNENEMVLRSKGKGRNRRYTSCKWVVFRQNVSYRPMDSGGYSVMQLRET